MRDPSTVSWYWGKLLAVNGWWVSRAVFAAVLAVGAGACGSSHPTAANTVYPLPSDGWKAGQPVYDSYGGGVFEATLASRGACAWLGPAKYAHLWPAGYGVRFHPTELNGPQGQVLARAGDNIAIRSGPLLAETPEMSRRCPMLHDGIIALNGNVSSPSSR